MESDPASRNDESKQPATNGTSGRADALDSVTIPDHQLLRRIGRGSYGTVVLARNSLGAYRAVKIVYRKSFSDQRPFERELSGIRKFEPVSRSHEGFIDVLHVGINKAEGYFYYVMELGDDCVSGQNFDPDQYVPKTLAREISKRGALGVRECLQLGLALSDALSELHRCGLVHRDIKPSNIIFVNGAPKLADIGLVAGLDDTRSYVGTEGFIPPEGPGSPQADVYSLGKVLYEACTGRDRQDFPELPTRVEELGDREQFLELNEVILHACKNESAKRYESASNMHADLVLVSNGKSVKRLKLLEQRLARLKRAGGVTALVLGAALIFSYPAYQEWRLRLENRQRQIGTTVANGIRAVEEGDLLAALPRFTEALQLDQSPERAPTYRLRFGAALAQAPKLTQVWSTAQEPVSCEFSPDGNQAVISQGFGQPLLFEIPTGRRVTLPIKVAHSLSAAFSLDGHSVVIAGNENFALVWNINSDKQPLRLPHPSPVRRGTFSPDGFFILTSCEDGLARLWSARSGQLECSFGPHSTNVTFATFSHNGKFVATTSGDGTCRIWNAGDGSPAGRPLHHEKWVNYAAFSPDDHLLVTASWDHSARVWEVPSGRRIMPDMLHEDAVNSAEFSPDGQLIVTASLDRTVRLWDAETLQPREGGFILQHGERAMQACFAPDGHRILTADTDGKEGTVRIWDLAVAVPPSPIPVSFSADCTRYLENSNGAVTVREAVSGGQIAQFRTMASTNQVRLNRNGRFAWAIAPCEGTVNGSPRQVKIWNSSTGQELSTGILVSNKASGASLSDDGRRIVVFGGTTAQVWDVNLEKPLSPPLKHPYDVSDAIFSPDGTRVATGCAYTVRVWDCINDKPLFALRHPTTVSDFEFSPDGSLLATCCSDETLKKYFAQVWDAATGRPVGPPLRHDDGVLRVNFSRDGRRLVTASEDDTARVWDARTGKPLTPALRHQGQVLGASFNPNANWVVTASADKTARIWESETGDPIASSLPGLLSFFDARFLPDDRTIAISDKREAVWQWKLPVDPSPLEDLSAIARLLSGSSDAAQGTSTSRKPEPLELTWQRLASRHPSDFTVSAEQVAAWHEFQATECEQHKKWFAAAFHLKQLLLLRPDDQTLRQRLAQAQQHLKSST
jgi:WD40 repeat protein/serine/threonine protein kinase